MTASIKPSSINLSSFTNDRIPTHGSIQLTLTIAGLTTHHEFIVTDSMDTEFLIGIDFLQRHKITLNLGENSLQTSVGSCKFFNRPKTSDKTAKIRAQKTTVIPPNTMQYIRGKVPASHTTVQGVTEPYLNTMSNTGLFIANAAVYSKNRTVPLQCINPTDENITIYKGKLLGFLQPLYCGELIHNVSIDEKPSISSTSTPTAPVSSEDRWTKEELFRRLRLNDIESKLPPKELNELKNLLWEYRSTFSYDDSDLGCCNMYEAKLGLKPNHQAKWIPSRPVPYKLEGEMERQIASMLKAGVIEPLTTPSNFNSPIFLVSKKSPPPNTSGSTPSQDPPKSYRFVVDLRSVNQATLDDSYELPNINHVLDKLGGNKFFSTFDFSSSFHQIPYSKDSRHITAFTYKNRRFNYARMVMGHKTSSSKFAFMIDKLIANLPITSLIYFIDDLMLGTHSIQQHLIDLRLLLGKLHSANLKLKPSKVDMLKSEVTYVGIKISAEGIRITDDRIESVKSLQPPTNVKSLQKVLGFFNYNRKFIAKYAHLAHPLYKLLRKDTKFNWDSDCSNSFNSLKDAMVNSTLLRHPDVRDPHNSYHVTLDASKWGFGATLSQEQEGTRYVVAYFSKSTPNYKREWGQTKLEFECLYAALRYWKVFLFNCRFRVITDCKSLLNWETIFAKNNPTMVRKLQELSTFNFTIQHISGEENVVADFLSRYPHHKHSVNKETQTDSLSVNMLHDTTASPDSCSPTTSVQAVPSPTQSETPEAADHPTPITSVPLGELPSHDDHDEPLARLFSDTQEGEVIHATSTFNTPSESPCVCSTPEFCKSTTQVSLIHGDPLPSESEIIASIQQQAITFPDTDTISAEQNKDPILKEIISWVQSGVRPKIQVNRTPAALTVLWKQFNLLSYERGLLLRKWINTKDPDTPRSLIVVPESLTEQVMEIFHKNIMSCHPGVDRTLHQCRHFFYWPKMKLDFTEYIAACTTCQETKQSHHFLRAPLKQLIFHHFNDCITVDHIVPEQEGRTPRGFRYILSITDCFSNYLVAVPVKSQTSKENIKAIFRNWVLTFGMPKELIVDNHPGFTSDFFSEVFKAFDCKKTHGTSYKSRSTGRAENSNKRLNQALRSILPKGKENQWDVYLSYATFALNCLSNRKTGFSANRMVFGTELNTPLSVLVEDSDSYKPSTVDCRSQEAYNLRKTIKTIIRKVRENSETDFRYAKNFHDRNLMGPFFKVADLCYLLINCPAHKFGSKWRGPFVITGVINDHLYRVLIAPNKEKVINISKMKHYQKSKYSANPLVNAQSTPAATESSKMAPTSREEPEFIMVEMTNPREPRTLFEEILPSTQPIRNQPVPIQRTPTPTQDISPDPSSPPAPNSSSTNSSIATPQRIPTPTQDPSPVPSYLHSPTSNSTNTSIATPQRIPTPIQDPSPGPSNTPTPTPDTTNTSIATPPSLQDDPQESADDMPQLSQRNQKRPLRPRSKIKSPARYLGYVLRLNRASRAVTLS